jgi:predicted PurR-regulated permease PerM
MSPNSLPPLHRGVLLVAGAVVIAAGLHAAAGTVNLVLISVLLAMSFSPIPDFLRRRGMKPVPAVVVAILAVIVGGVVVLGTLAGALTGLQEKLPVYQTALTGLIGHVEEWLTKHHVNLHKIPTPDTARIVALVGDLVSGSLQAMGYGLLVLILVAMILFELPTRLDGDHPASKFRDRFDAVSISVRRFVELTGFLGAAQAGLSLLVMLAVGTDFAFVWAVLFFLLGFVPFGFAIGIIPALIVTLLAYGTTRAVVLLVILMVINTICDNVVRPKLMGKGLGLSPLIVTLSLIFWSLVLGPIGAILAVPLTIAMVTVAPRYFGDSSSEG